MFPALGTWLARRYRPATPGIGHQCQGKPAGGSDPAPALGAVNQVQLLPQVRDLALATFRFRFSQRIKDIGHQLPPIGETTDLSLGTGAFRSL